MKKIVLFMMLFTLLAACGKKEVKQVSPESKLTMEAFALAEKIRDAFVIKDVITLQKNSTDAGFKDMMSNAKGYDSVEITFTPRWVDMENNQIDLNVSWKSTWAVAGKKKEERGMAVFLIEGTPLKVSKILRGNPFVTPE